ncbi:MAG: membrane protein insertase YidC [Armatimonadetes bacterium]|nr:membrane protein insertase YidC [Anaerolineae bacterium]
MTWDILINPLVTLLTLFYSVFGNNIVVGIACLTILIRLATSPLLIQQQRSAASMQQVQPKLKKLQEKYKNDREKMSQAQMELYREHGINPLGGCLPLLVQLPILFALYSTITYGLSSTPFQLVDLANRLLIPSLEPLLPLNKIWLGMDLTQTPTIEASKTLIAYSLPVFVLITTWLQSKLTIPTPPPPEPGAKPDPTMQMTRQMTTIMPVMYGFFALSFPIGMSIYFIVGNLVGITQYTLLGKADWRGLLRLPPKEQPKLASGVRNDDDDDDLPQLVTSTAKPKPVRTNGTIAGTASKEVLMTKPTPSTRSASANGSSAKSKKKR